jgi:hypothetical protein
MTQAETRHSTPPTNSSKIHEERLNRQERKRAAALERLAKLRRQARAEIDRLILFLDQSDTYVMTELELEDEADEADHEPSLGSLDRAMNQTRWPQGGNDERDDADDEPSLGSCESHPSAPPVTIGRNGPVMVGGNRPEPWRSFQGDQSGWADGYGDDREEDAGDEREQDPAESGIGDYDGVLEQFGHGDWQHHCL